MSIPPGSLVTEIDFLDPACFTNGGTSVTDLSGNSNDWTLNNTSYTYNSVYGSIDCPIGTELAPNNVTFLGTGVVPFTMNFWHYATATSESIFYNGCYPGDGYFGPQCYWNGTNLIYRVNTFYGPIDTGIYSINAWHMFTVEYDGITLKIYIDGVYAAGGNRNLNQTGARTGIAFSNILDNTGVNGLALINVYDVAIGAGEIANLYSEQLPRFTQIISYDFSNALCYPGSGSTVFDLAGSLDLPISGATYVSTGQASYFSFDGSNDYIGKNGVTGLGNTFSVSMWSQYPSSATTQMFQFSAGTYDAAQGAGPQSSITNTSVDIAFNDGIGTTSYATTPNVWHLYTFTADGTTVKGYLDGALQASVAQGIGSWDNGGLYLGVPISTGGSPYPGYYFNGKIATFDVYNVALGSTDVANVYAANSYRFDNLVISYDFSDPLCYPGTGNTVFDLSGSEIDLPIINATFGGTGQSKYFDFNGTNALIGKNGVTGLGVTFSVSMWAKYPSSATSLIFPFSAGSYVASQGAGPLFSINDGSTNSALFYFNDGIGTTSFATTPDVWHNYIFTNDGTTTKAYKDGVLAASVAQGIGSWDTGGLYLGVPVSTGGNYQPVYYFDGEIAIFDVYNTALGSAAVSDLYDIQSLRFGITPPTPTLIGSYDFSDPACWPGSGNTVFDLTAENNDLAINIISFGGTGQSKFASFNNDTSWMFKSPFSASGSTFNSNEFSISLWHNYPTQGTFGGVSYLLMGGVNAAGQGPSIVVDNADQVVKGVFGAEIVAGGWVSGIANTINTWHMTTLVGDGTNFLLYQDGALTGSTSQAGQWGGSNLVLGRPTENPTGPAQGLFGHKYGGYIAIAEIYSGALGSTDVSDLYDLQQPRFYPAPPPPSNLVASYDFSDPLCYPGTGNTVFDLSDVGLDLPIVNATYGGTGQSKYFEFSGGSSYIGKTGVSGLGTSFSISIWSQTSVTSSSNQVTFFAGNDGISSSAPAFYYNVPTIGEISASFNYGTGLITEPYVLDTWENYVYTADGTTVKFYKNGVEVGSVSQGPGNWPNGQFYLGYTTDALIGKIGLFNVYNTALGSTAVSTLYNNTENRFLPAPPPAPPSIVGGRQFAQGFNG
jgi:hypothetical protein